MLKEHNLPCQEHLIFHLPLGFSHTPQTCALSRVSHASLLPQTLVLATSLPLLIPQCCALMKIPPQSLLQPFAWVLRELCPFL